MKFPIENTLLGCCVAFAMTFGVPMSTAADLETSDIGYGTRWYVSVFGGFSFQENAKFRGTITPPGGSQSVNVDFDDGFVVGGALGARLNEWNFGALTPRLEIELSYRENDVDEVNFSGNGPAAEANPRGDVGSIFLMGNVLLDLPSFANDKLTPFFGGGLGIAFVDNNIRYGPPGPGFNLSESDEAFALQFIAGFDFKLTENIALTVDGRYYRAFAVKSDRLTPAGVNTGSPDADIDGFNLNGGIRLEF